MVAEASITDFQAWCKDAQEELKKKESTISTLGERIEGLEKQIAEQTVAAATATAAAASTVTALAIPYSQARDSPNFTGKKSSATPASSKQLLSKMARDTPRLLIRAVANSNAVGRGFPEFHSDFDYDLDDKSIPLPVAVNLVNDALENNDRINFTIIAQEQSSVSAGNNISQDEAHEVGYVLLSIQRTGRKRKMLTTTHTNTHTNKHTNTS